MSERLSDPRDLAATLGPARSRLLALDFDGVLAPIVDHPDAAAAPAEVIDAVAQLAARTTVAVVSGRPVDDLQARMGDLPVAWAGGHGARIVHTDGSEERLVDAAAITATLDDIEASLRDLVDDEPGWLVERKEASLAVHHRLSDPDRRDDLLPRVHAQLEARRSSEPGFDLLDGKAVLELRPSGTDKGAALARIADRHPELTPLVLGDDTTDEDAFRVAAQLGGSGVLVAELPRHTLATYRIADPRAVGVFLAALVDQTT